MKFSTCTIVFRLDDAEVGDGVHPCGHVVLGDHLLRRHVQRHRAQIDLDHPVDNGDQQKETRALRHGQKTAKAEDHPPLVLPRDFDRGKEEEQDDDDDCSNRDQDGGHGVPFNVVGIDRSTVHDVRSTTSLLDRARPTTSPCSNASTVNLLIVPSALRMHAPSRQ